MAWKIGDWCFCEAELSQISEMEGDRITGISNGIIHHGSNSLNDRCFPLSLETKNISDEVEYWQRKIREASKRIALNWPQISEWFITHWCTAVLAKGDARKVAMKDIATFAEQVIEKCEEGNDIRVGGVLLLRQ